MLHPHLVRLLLLPLLFGALSEAGAAPKFFNYELSNVPRRTSDCTGVAREIGERFQKVTGLVPFGTTGTDEGPHCHVKVTYAAEAALPLVTTAPRKILSGDGGAYATAGACEAALPGKAERFERYTGLSPVARHCEYRRTETNRPYLLRLESFGKAATPLQFFDEMLDFGPVHSNAAAVEAEVTEKLERNGVSVHEVALQGPRVGGWYSFLSLSYYSKTPRLLELLRALEYSDVESCGKAAQAATTFFEGARSPLFGAFCLAHGGILTLHLLIERPLSFSLTGPPEQSSYATAAECDGDRARVEEAYRKIGWTVFGSLCGRRQTRHELWVFARPGAHDSLPSF